MHGTIRNNQGIPNQLSNQRFILLSIALGLLVGLGAFFGRSLYQSVLDRVRPDSYYSGIQNASPAVVSLYTSETIYRRADDQSSGIASENSIAPAERRQTSQGSGVIITEDGYVLTNHHLVGAADDINIALADGRLFKASKVGADPETDLAVVKIDTSESLPSCGLEHDAEARVGDIVLAIGNPFGVGQTVTQGIISATRRRIDGTSHFQQFLQVDAAINPGNSGGALINTRGDLLGINSAVFSTSAGAEGIGFSIPTTLIRQVVPEIIQNGRVARGWLGIGADNLQQHPDLYNLSQQGAVVSGVFRDSPAHQAGLRRGDIVTQVNGVDILSADQLLMLVSSHKPNDVLQLAGLRQIKPLQLQITLAERPDFDSRP